MSGGHEPDSQLIRLFPERSNFDFRIADRTGVGRDTRTVTLPEWRDDSFPERLNFGNRVDGDLEDVLAKVFDHRNMAARSLKPRFDFSFFRRGAFPDFHNRSRHVETGLFQKEGGNG